MAAIGGQVSLVGAYVPVLMGQVKGGKLRAVGVAATSRMNVMPDVPTFAEQGFPKFTTTIWYSVLAPKGTPDPVLGKLTAATLKVVKEPQFVQRLQAGGAEPLPGSPDEVITTMRTEQKLWVEVANAK
jgi:tripartite-type tricarboxylate transporter receptor subunit TctC